MSNKTEQSTVIPAHQGWCLFFKICSSRLSSTALYWQEIQTEETNWNIYTKTHKFATIKCKPSKEFTRRGNRGSNQNYPLLLTENSYSMVSLCLLNVRLRPFSKYIPCHLGRNIKKGKRPSVIVLFLLKGLLPSPPPFLDLLHKVGLLRGFA